MFYPAVTAERLRESMLHAHEQRAATAAAMEMLNLSNSWDGTKHKGQACKGAVLLSPLSNVQHRRSALRTQQVDVHI